MADSGDSPIDKVTENLQKALEDLRSAGEKATGDVRTRIDDAVKRVTDASDQARSGAQDQIASFREVLEKATEDVRAQLAKLAIRAQDSVETLESLQKDIEDRLEELRK